MVSQVWHRIGVDLIGPLPVTSRHNRYIITVTGAFTKWIEATAVPDKTSATTAQYIYDLFCRYGCCKVQVNDRGGEFVNGTFELLHKLCGVERRLTSAYHPQTNGQTERFNRTLVDTLTKICTTKANWDMMLGPALFAYQTAVHRSTGHSPFRMIFGRDPKLPIDIMQKGEDLFLDADTAFDTQADIMQSAEAHMQIMDTILEKSHSKASIKIVAAQATQKNIMISGRRCHRMK